MNRELMVRKEGTIRELLEKPETRKRIKQAIPAHIDEGQFLRIVLGVILSNEKLMECTPRSLLTSVMAIAQLGLSPIPELGQAFIVPFGTEAKFIAGYRGYITLARRSGEVQNVTSQEVFENDRFELQYGTDEKLVHIPADGDRGKSKGAYVVFRYKAGGHSFDYMSVEDIDKIRDRFSKQPNGLMWKEMPGEGRKKTVIRRHVKLVPLAVEIQRAAALEDRAYGGESQFDMVFPEIDGRPQINGGSLGEWQDLLAAKCGDEGVPESLTKYIKVTAGANEMTEEQLLIAASRSFDKFWEQYEIWAGKETKKRGRGKAKTTTDKDPKVEEKAPQEPTSEAETEAEPTEKSETGDKGQNDRSRPIGDYPLLFTTIPNRVIGTGLDDVQRLLPQQLTADQANRILLVLKKKAIDRDEFILKVAEICKKKE